jgi:hypothetical protein
MAKKNGTEKMIQIGREGGIWVPVSVAKKFKLSATKNGGAESLIPSTMSGPAPEINESSFSRLRSGWQVEISPDSIGNFIKSTLRVLRPPTPGEVISSLRKVVANSSCVL